MAVEEQLFDDRPSLVAALAGEIAVRLTDAVAARGRASLVVTGGSTPGPLYDELCKAAAPWEHVEITLSDERWVDTDSKDSNEALVRERLLRERAAAALFIGMKTPDSAPIEAVRAVGRAIDAMPRPFDVTLLGMGDDCHIASLFPNAPELAKQLAGDGGTGPVCAVSRPGAAGATERMSLTLKALLASRWIVIQIEGEAKLAALRLAQTPGETAGLPVRALLHQDAAPVEAWWAP